MTANEGRACTIPHMPLILISCWHYPRLQWLAPITKDLVNINAFLAIGVVGLIATFMTELAAGLLTGAFGQHSFGSWLPYYVVWIVFTVFGVVAGRQPQQK